MTAPTITNKSPAASIYMKTIKALLLPLVAVTILTTVVGCKNTAKGVGKDIEKAGEKIQEKSK